MKLTSISCGRTYNTGCYTSQRYDMSADLEPGEYEEQAMEVLADLLHGAALVAMRSQGIAWMDEQGGRVRIAAPVAGAFTEGSDDDDIPF